jgi:hypothetical protein
MKYVLAGAIAAAVVAPVLFATAKGSSEAATAKRECHQEWIKVGKTAHGKTVDHQEFMVDCIATKAGQRA